MSFTCALHLDRCTFQNALVWRVCGSHFYQAWVQPFWKDKLIHLIVGLVEVLPVVGQIVSLIETGILSFYKPAPPVEVNPGTELRKDKKYNYPWPVDIERLGLEETQIAPLDKLMTDIVESWQSYTQKNAHWWISAEKRELKYAKGGQTCYVQKLPVALHVYKVDKGPPQFILLAKTVFFNSGGERKKIRWAFNFETKQWCIKKRATGKIERTVVNAMEEARGQSDILWRKTKDKTRRPKLQMIEPLREGTLSILLGTRALSDFGVKKKLCSDLLTEVKRLHAVRIEKGPNFLPPFFAYHSDIKMENTVVFQKMGVWNIHLSDFGRATANPTERISSVGFTPREFVEFYMDRSRSENEAALIEFNLLNGHLRDLWSVGLVLLTILVGSTQRLRWFDLKKQDYVYVDIAPLRCLKECLQSSVETPHREAGILNLKQSLLDAEIERLQWQVMQKHPKECEEVIEHFLIVKRMLRMDCKERVLTFPNQVKRAVT